MHLLFLSENKCDRIETFTQSAVSSITFIPIFPPKVKEITALWNEITL